MLGMVVRFIVSALVLMFVGLLIPGSFSVGGFWGALLAAVAIAVVGYIVEALFGRRVSNQGRGIVGFLVGAVVIWLAQLFVPTMHVTLWGALLASFLIGLIDSFVPTALR